MTIVDAATPDFDSQVETVTASMRSIRQGYRDLAAGIFAHTLEPRVPWGDDGVTHGGGVVLLTAAHNRAISMYGDAVLGGWNKQLPLLGFDSVAIAI